MSACYFDALCNPGKHQHAVLPIAQLPFPRTGAAIAECLDNFLSEWEISAEKVMLVVSDNDSNIIKTINILAENAAVAKTQNNDYKAAVCDMH